MNLIALVIVAVIAPVQQARDTTVTTPVRTGTAVLSGLVVTDDDAKRPVRRATVLVVEEGGLSSGRTTVTNDAGEFLVSGLPSGRYNITATKGAYLSATYGATRQHRPGTLRTGTAVAVAEGQALSGLELRMMRGAVITGVIRDETGRPARGIALMVAFFTRSPQTGERVLTRFQFQGTRATDSRGVYRIFGLPPGEYVVAGYPSGFAASDLMPTTEADRARATATARPEAQAAPIVARPRVGFVPIHFPGTPIPGNATPVRVGPGEERAGIDFSMQLVPNSRVEGAVIGLNGQPASRAQVLVHNEAKPASPDPGRFGASTDPQGRFSVSGLPPGSYTISSSTPDAWGATSITVQGDDVRANIQMRPSIPITGRLSVDEETTTPPELARVRLRLVAESVQMPLAAGGYTLAPSADGRFRGSVVPGRYRLQVTGPAIAGTASTWIVKSAMVGKQDVADQAFEVREGDTIPEAVLTLTNRTSELSGRMTSAEGRAAPEYFVIVFPTDAAMWGWQARRIQQTRPSHDGAFSFRNLPPGEYFIAAVSDVEPNEWFDSEFLKSLSEASIRLSLAAGEKKTQVIQVK